MPFNSTRGTKRSDLNNEKLKWNEARQLILEFITYGINYINQQDLADFQCPFKSCYQGWRSFVTTEYCESMNNNNGCTELVNGCKCYDEQKKIEKAFAEIDFKRIYQYKEEELARIRMVKNGELILAKNKEITGVVE